jgi:hypothetical protein
MIRSRKQRRQRVSSAHDPTISSGTAVGAGSAGAPTAQPVPHASDKPSPARSNSAVAKEPAAPPDIAALKAEALDLILQLERPTDQLEVMKQVHDLEVSITGDTAGR